MFTEVPAFTTYHAVFAHDEANPAEIRHNGLYGRNGLGGYDKPLKLAIPFVGLVFPLMREHHLLHVNTVDCGEFPGQGVTYGILAPQLQEDEAVRRTYVTHFV